MLSQRALGLSRDPRVSRTCVAIASHSHEPGIAELQIELRLPRSSSSYPCSGRKVRAAQTVPTISACGVKGQERQAPGPAVCGSRANCYLTACEGKNPRPGKCRRRRRSQSSLPGSKRNTRVTRISLSTIKSDIDCESLAALPGWEHRDVVP